MKGYVLGKQTEIVIDDFLPFYSWGVPAYTKQSLSGGLWGPFIEKAWAKANGNYEMVEGGNAAEALGFITGAPTINYFKDSRGPAANPTFYNTSSQPWSIIVNGDNKNFTMTAGVGSALAGENATYTKLGLVRNHLYTLIGAYTLRNSAGAIVDYVYRIRNPWGVDDAFNGTWRDSSSLWADTTNNYRAQVPYVNANDGTYFVSFQEFFDNFNSFSISYFYDNYAHTST